MDGYSYNQLVRPPARPLVRVPRAHSLRLVPRPRALHPRIPARPLIPCTPVRSPPSFAPLPSVLRAGFLLEILVWGTL